MDALHILAGFGVFLLLVALARRGFGSRWPLLILLVLELFNEAYDLSVERWPDLGMQLGEGAKDILLTMALPALLTSIARWRPDLLWSKPQQDNRG